MNEAEVSQSKEGLNAILPKIRMGTLICSPFIKYGIVSIGVKSDWKDGLRTAVYETRTYGGVRGAPWAYGSRPSTRLVAGKFCCQV